MAGFILLTGNPFKILLSEAAASRGHIRVFHANLKDHHEHGLAKALAGNKAVRLEGELRWHRFEESPRYDNALAVHTVSVMQWYTRKLPQSYTHRL